MMENKISKWVKGIILTIVLILIGVSVIGEYNDGVDDLSPEVRCETENGVYNTSNAITCHEAANVSASVSYYDVPLGGLFNNNGVMTLVIMGIFLVAVISGLFAMNRKR